MILLTRVSTRHSKCTIENPRHVLAPYVYLQFAENVKTIGFAFWSQLSSGTPAVNVLDLNSALFTGLSAIVQLCETPNVLVVRVQEGFGYLRGYKSEKLYAPSTTISTYTISTWDE